MVVDRPNSTRDDESLVSGMDVDERGSELGFERVLKPETIFAKSDELHVSFYAHLPAEVKLVLRNAGKSSLFCQPNLPFTPCLH